MKNLSQMQEHWLPVPIHVAHFVSTTKRDANNYILFHTWLICTAETWTEHTDEWLGEFGRDLQGPIESCCFFLVATIFCATVKTKLKEFDYIETL